MTTFQSAILLGALLAAVFAAWLLLREKRIIPIIAFAAGVWLLAAELAIGSLPGFDSTVGGIITGLRVRLVLLSFAPAVWLTFAVTYSRGDYHFLLKRWMPLIGGLLILVPAIALIGWAHLIEVTLENMRLGLAGRMVHIALVLSSTAVLMNIERTFRASVGTMRWQLKFVTIGVAALFLSRIYTSTQTLLFSAIDPTLDTYNAVALVLCCVLTWRSVTRSKTFMLDLYPSTTLLHRSLTVVVVGAYLLAVGFLAKAVAMLGKPGAFPLQALLLLAALVALGLVLLSDRLRLQAKRFVGRHLRRPVYDVRKIWREFNDRTAGHASEQELCRASTRWLSETFETLSVTLWLAAKDGSAVTFGASTSITEAAAQNLAVQCDVTDALKKLQGEEGVVDLDETKDAALGKLRILQPAQFLEGGHRFCLGVRAGSELMAILILGDRVGGASFTVEELDLIRCVANQIGGDIQRLGLAGKLGEAKEIQAFQTMATFFVHDLKNTVWSLSLLVDNLGRHFDDPKFREEAVKALSTSVARMNDLIARIGSLREQLRLNREPVSFDKIVAKMLDEFSGMQGATLTKSLQANAEASLDVEQFQKVVKNLILNAREAATNGHGTIKVNTEAQEGYTVLTVQDDGCGMSEEFLRTKLFRPFQTTKNKGIGIGMFQSKMIVEAHEGKMLVESKQGVGTTIRVMIPSTGDRK